MTELTDVLKREHKPAEKCHIYLKEFNNRKDRKARNHYHYAGLNRGASHSNCNLKYQIPDDIPILFHHLSGYDTHPFIKEHGKNLNNVEIGAIAENKEMLIIFNVTTNVKLAGLNNKDGMEVRKNIQFRLIGS